MIYFAWPGFRSKALTLSYDDGMKSDEKLVSMLNQYGIRATFNLNSACMDEERRISANRIQELYRGHEVSTHGAKHLTLERCPVSQLMLELVEDRKALEQLVGAIVCGHAYPNGSYDECVRQVLPGLGIHYARVAESTGTFGLPHDFYEWKPTCHHNENLLEKADEFIRLDLPQFWQLMYVWGHSYEFDRDGNWNLMEEFCKKIGGLTDIWYATNAEICHYMQAARQVYTSVDGHILCNGSGEMIYLIADEKQILLQPGEYKTI